MNSRRDRQRLEKLWRQKTGSSGGVDVEEVDDRVASLLQAGANVTLTYDDTANTITIAASGSGGGGGTSNGYFPGGW